VGGLRSMRHLICDVAAFIDLDATIMILIWNLVTFGDRWRVWREHLAERILEWVASRVSRALSSRTIPGSGVFRGSHGIHRESARQLTEP